MFYKASRLSSIFLARGRAFFFPNCLRRVFLFNCSCQFFSFQSSTLRGSVQLCRFNLFPRVLIRVTRQKVSHSFYSKGFRSSTSHYFSLSVSASYCDVYAIHHRYNVRHNVKCLFFFQNDRKWTRLPEFKPRTGLFAFHIALTLLGKV